MPIPRNSSAINGLKFIRKSDLNPDFFENKSVISIKGEREYEYRFAKQKDSNNTVPMAKEGIFDN